MHQIRSGVFKALKKDTPAVVPRACCSMDGSSDIKALESITKHAWWKKRQV